MPARDPLRFPERSCVRSRCSAFHGGARNCSASAWRAIQCFPTRDAEIHRRENTAGRRGSAKVSRLFKHSRRSFPKTGFLLSNFNEPRRFFLHFSFCNACKPRIGHVTLTRRAQSKKRGNRDQRALIRSPRRCTALPVSKSIFPRRINHRDTHRSR